MLHFAPGNLTNVNGTLFFTANDGYARHESCGRATAPPPAPSSSRTSTPAAPALPQQPDERERHAVLHGQRRHARVGAVEERRHRRRHRPGQGHQPRHRQLATPATSTNVNGTLFFTADDGTNGCELWKSDGTAAGTVLVKDINPAQRLLPQHLTNVNGTLFFTANDGTHGHELWKSDGTAAGTVLVKDIQPSPAPMAAVLPHTRRPRPDERQRHAVLHGQRRHARAGAVEERRHRRRHRAGQGHQPRQQRRPARATSRTSTGRCSSRPTTAIDGDELWKSDGTAAGTVLVKDINTSSSQLLSQNS